MTTSTGAVAVAGSRHDATSASTATTAFRTDSHTITLVAVSGLAPVPYFAAIEKDVTALEGAGATIHTSGPSGVSRRLRDITRRWAYRRSSLASKALARHLGWLSADEVLRGFRQDHPTWQAHDATREEVIQRWTFVGAVASAISSRIVVKLLRTVIAERPDMVYGPRAGNTASLPVRAREVISLRASEAIEAATNERGDVVMLWSTQHVPELTERLLERGYTVAETTWRTVTTFGPHA